MVKIGDFVDKLHDEQVFCGNVDPVGMVVNGSVEEIKKAVTDYIILTKERGIVSAGCEIVKTTDMEKYNAMLDAIDEYGETKMLK